MKVPFVIRSRSRPIRPEQRDCGRSGRVFDRAGYRPAAKTGERTFQGHSLGITSSDTERRNARIEKEGLAQVSACEIFRDFLVGKDFHLETDHKPLVSIFGSKAIDDLTPRLQGMRMRLVRYTYNISYVTGKDLTAADALLGLQSDSPKQQSSRRRYRAS